MYSYCNFYNAQWNLTTKVTVGLDQSDPNSEVTILAGLMSYTVMEMIRDYTGWWLYY